MKDDELEKWSSNAYDYTGPAISQFYLSSSNRN